MARTGCFRKHWMSKRCMDLDRHAPRHPLSVEEASPAESPPPGRPQPRSRAAAVSMPRSWCSDGGCQGAPLIVGTALSDRRRSSGRATTGHLPAVLRPSRAGGRTRRTGPHDVLPPGVVPDPWAGVPPRPSRDTVPTLTRTKRTRNKRRRRWSVRDRRHGNQRGWPAGAYDAPTGAARTPLPGHRPATGRRLPARPGSGGHQQLQATGCLEVEAHLHRPPGAAAPPGGR